MILKQSKKLQNKFYLVQWLLNLIVLLLGLVLGIIVSNNRQSFPQNRGDGTAIEKKNWQTNDAAINFLEAITKIKNLDYYVQNTTDRQQILQDSLKALLEKIDPFSAFMTAEDFSKWNKAQGDDYTGVGMEIVKNRDGEIICIPLKDGPAYKAGIRTGDRLIAIENQPVKDKSIMTIGTLSRKGNNSLINLVVQAQTGKEKKVSLKKSLVSYDSVNFSWDGEIAIIEVGAFTVDTKAKIQEYLNTVENANPIVVDLRSNAGGDLLVAIDSADLFLGEGKVVVSVKTRKEAENHISGKKAVNLKSPVFVWLDEGTASAAEVFAAALTENRRAVSIGKNTFGKGTRQEIIELSDGSALFLTTGIMQTPNGNVFDGKGLSPDYPLEKTQPKTEDYIRTVKSVLTP